MRKNFAKIFILIIVAGLAFSTPKSYAVECTLAAGANCNSGACGVDEMCQIDANSSTGFSCTHNEICVQCSAQDACGVTGGCASGEMCTSVPGEGLVCVTNSTCTPGCNFNVIGQCGGAGGCANLNEKCVAEGFTWVCKVPVAPEPACPGLPSGTCSDMSNACGANGQCAFNQKCLQQGATRVCQATNSHACDQCRSGVAGDCPSGTTCGTNAITGHLECLSGTPPATPPVYNGNLLSIEDILKYFFAITFPVGIAFGMFSIIKAGYTLKTSEGNPTKIKEGQEELTAAILGTLFILLSLVILRVIIRSVIGVNAPGF